MKHTKTIILVLLTFLMLLSSVPFAYAAKKGSDGNISWTYNADTKTLKIKGEGEMKDYSRAGAPWSNLSNKVQKVMIYPGVTSIGSQAFSSFYKMKSIRIPESVYEIGRYAFSYCSALKKINLPDVTEIKEGTFFRSGLRSIKIPDGVFQIGKEAFARCDGLKTIVFPDKDRFDIGDSAFKNCDGLKSVVLPKNTQCIGEQAFADCSQLKDLVLEEGIHEIGKEAFRNCAIQSLTIPGSVHTDGDNERKFGGGAFKYCGALKEVTVQEGVDYIAEEAFLGCSKLQTVTLPESLVYVDKYAFTGCSTLKNVNVCGKAVDLDEDENGITIWFGVSGDWNGHFFVETGNEPLQDSMKPEKDADATSMADFCKQENCCVIIKAIFAKIPSFLTKRV